MFASADMQTVGTMTMLKPTGVQSPTKHESQDAQK